MFSFISIAYEKKQLPFCCLGFSVFFYIFRFDEQQLIVVDILNIGQGFCYIPVLIRRNKSFITYSSLLVDKSYTD